MKIYSLLFLLSLGLFAISCSDDDDDVVMEEEMEETCETSELSYTNGIANIIDGSCAIVGCHISGTTTTFPMGNYDETFIAVGFGRIIGAINHEEGFLPMPRPVGSDKIDQCSIDQITAWINDGAPE